MAESEAEKAAAEAYPDSMPMEITTIYRLRGAFMDGAQWHASRLSPPTREELARALYVAGMWGVEGAGQGWDEGKVLPPVIEQFFRLADAALRFSPSAPEEDQNG